MHKVTRYTATAEHESTCPICGHHIETGDAVFETETRAGFCSRDCTARSLVGAPMKHHSFRFAASLAALTLVGCAHHPVAIRAHSASRVDLAQVQAQAKAMRLAVADVVFESSTKAMP